VDADGDTDAIALFAYALVEQDRVDWVAHYIANHDNIAPTPDQTVEWYRGKPESYFLDRERTAENWYAEFARWYLREEIDDQKQAAINTAVGNLGRFWPAFWNGNLVGVTSNIIFTVLVVLFVATITTDFSFIAWAKGLFTSHQPLPK
jgi:hypothetical protein